MREMKNSGIEWIGEIPSDWDTSRLQWLMYEIKENNNPIKTTQVLSLTNKLGVVPYEDKGNQGNKAKEDYSQYGLAFENTLVINSMNVLIGSVGISKYFGCVSPVYYVFKNTENSDLRYINYIFQNVGFQKELRKYANGILEIRLRISAHDMLRRIVPYPSLREQIKIADFLDEKCAEIDTIIEKTKATIEKYKNLKQAVIIQTITKGVNHNCEIKSSGIDWIGDVPINYEIIKIKYVTDISRGIFNHRPRNDERYYGGKYPFIQTGDVARAIKYITTYSQTLNELGISVSKMFPKGTMTMSIAANIGDVAILGFDAYFPDSVIGFTPKFGYCENYVYYLFCSMKEKFMRTAVVSTQLNLNIERIKELYVPITKDVIEQEQIADYLDKKCSEIDELIAKKTTLLSELESYKKSLIYEYVTGKKEV